MSKRFERLGWTEKQVGIDISLELLKNTLSSTPPTAYEMAWKKLSLADDRSLVAILYFMLEDDLSSKKHALEIIGACEEFFFGTWRFEFLTPEKKIEPAWWKRRFIWMQTFETALLWGSVLGRWDFLEKIGTFPEPDSCISDGYRDQDRDLYVALGAFLRRAPPAELEALLEKAATGSRKSCKLLVSVIHACLARDTVLLQKSLLDFLKHYKKNDFPKQEITKKISILGTLFVHWAKNEGLIITVPPEFIDHIVNFRD